MRDDNIFTFKIQVYRFITSFIGIYITHSK